MQRMGMVTIVISGWWFGTFVIFPYIGNVIIPIVSYFSEALKPPTSIYIYMYLFRNMVSLYDISDNIITVEIVGDYMCDYDTYIYIC